jgi:hypothetical protein
MVALVMLEEEGGEVKVVEEMDGGIFQQIGRHG